MFTLLLFFIVNDGHIYIFILLSSDLLRINSLERNCRIKGLFFFSNLKTLFIVKIFKPLQIRKLVKEKVLIKKVLYESKNTCSITPLAVHCAALSTASASPGFSKCVPDPGTSSPGGWLKMLNLRPHTRPTQIDPGF